ncbi:MAG TPA: mechanosensitive ion channel protein MscS [Cryomorphaceae bacterium]|nr:mechanosensitive ion channel protein MscS [Cryomorphaceae bacterium]|tara:strand:- start:4860 stop:5720 length:861 start_codon:yes stop_codon:yes gene_type:complete
MAQTLDKIKNFIDTILDYRIWDNAIVKLSIQGIVEVILLFLVARIIIWFIKRWLYNFRLGPAFDDGRRYTIFQITKYVVYTVIIVMGLETLGVEVTTILAAETALFVGIGLGLQDAFKDLSSGIIILMERTISAGDIIRIGEEIGKVESIGLRTTTIRSRDDILIIMPNHRITNEAVTNLTLQNAKTRFSIKVGVEYGADVDLVKKVLVECVEKNKNTSNNESFVLLRDFGESSIIFEVLFYSRDPFIIEATKSEIRFEIDRRFRESGITIPFPQRTVWHMNPENK